MQGGFRHMGIIVGEALRAALAVGPGVKQRAVLVHALDDGIKGADGGGDPFRALEGRACQGHGADGEAIPVSQQFFVALRPGPLAPRRQQQGALLGHQGFIGFGRRLAVVETAQNDLALEVAVTPHAIHLLEACRESTGQGGVNFRFAPGVIFAFFIIGVSTEAAGEGAIQLHVAQQPFHRFIHPHLAQLVAVELPHQGHETDQQGVVAQRLFEVRHHPALIGGVAEKAAADVIVKATHQHVVHGGRDDLQILHQAGAQIAAP